MSIIIFTFFSNNDLTFNPAPSSDVKLPNFIPVGSPTFHKFEKKILRKINFLNKVDFLYPICSMNSNYFTSSVPRIRAFTLFEIQKRILICLSELKNKKILIKLQPEGNLSIELFLKNIRHNFLLYKGNKLTRDLFLEYGPTNIILDRTFTVLSEALLTNANIITYTPLPPENLTEKSEYLLKKRIYIYENIEKLLLSISSQNEQNIHSICFQTNNEAKMKMCIFQGNPHQTIENELIKILI